MVGMLYAIPKTPLHARLTAEGRLDLDDEPPFGTNVIPLRMTRDELRDGYIDLMRDLYDPDVYFERLENLYLTRRFDFGRARKAYWRRHPWRKLAVADGRCCASPRPVPPVDEERSRPELRRIYRRRMTTILRSRPDPRCCSSTWSSARCTTTTTRCRATWLNAGPWSTRSDTNTKVVSGR